MAHIIINPSLSAAIGYKFFFNPPKFAVVIAILEPANSTRTDNSTLALQTPLIFSNGVVFASSVAIVIPMLLKTTLLWGTSLNIP